MIEVIIASLSNIPIRFHPDTRFIMNDSGLTPRILNDSSIEFFNQYPLVISKGEAA